MKVGSATAKCKTIKAKAVLGRAHQAWESRAKHCLSQLVTTREKRRPLGEKRRREGKGAFSPNGQKFLPEGSSRYMFLCTYLLPTFFGEGSRTTIDCRRKTKNRRTKTGTLILTSLEDLVLWAQRGQNTWAELQELDSSPSTACVRILAHSVGFGRLLLCATRSYALDESAEASRGSQIPKKKHLEKRKTHNLPYSETPTPRFFSQRPCAFPELDSSPLPSGTDGRSDAQLPAAEPAGAAWAAPAGLHPHPHAAHRGQGHPGPGAKWQTGVPITGLLKRIHVATSNTKIKGHHQKTRQCSGV